MREQRVLGKVCHPDVLIQHMLGVPGNGCIRSESLASKWGGRLIKARFLEILAAHERNSEGYVEPGNSKRSANGYWFPLSRLIVVCVNDYDGRVTGRILTVAAESVRLGLLPEARMVHSRFPAPYLPDGYDWLLAA